MAVLLARPRVINGVLLHAYHHFLSFHCRHLTLVSAIHTYITYITCTQTIILQLQYIHSTLSSHPAPFSTARNLSSADTVSPVAAASSHFIHRPRLLHLIFLNSILDSSSTSTIYQTNHIPSSGRTTFCFLLPHTLIPNDTSSFGAEQELQRRLTPIQSSLSTTVPQSGSAGREEIRRAEIGKGFIFSVYFYLRELPQLRLLPVLLPPPFAVSA